MTDEDGRGGETEGTQSASSPAERAPGDEADDEAAGERAAASNDGTDETAGGRSGEATDRGRSDDGGVADPAYDRETADDDREAAVRAYYRALDANEYDAFEDLLAPEFVHERPDMRLQGRGRFVQFMREERPQRATTHEVEAVYADRGSDEGPVELAVRGRLIAANGDELFGFVDVFRFREGRIDHLLTFTD